MSFALFGLVKYSYCLDNDKGVWRLNEELHLIFLCLILVIHDMIYMKVHYK